ncbi:MAG: cohesin domain-containing protein [archaeon]
MVLWLGCESIDNPGADNPLDPDNPGYIEPEVTIVDGPAPDMVESIPNVTFIVGLNETAQEFVYRLNQSVWSSWRTDTVVTLTFLDEGDYLFECKARNTVGIEGQIIGSTFRINAITGPALRFYPRKVSVAPNEEFTVEVWAEEVNNLAGAEVEIPINTDVLEFISVDYLSILGEAGNLLCVNEDTPGTALFKSTQYRVGQPATVSGSGSLMRLTFKFKGAQSSQLAFSTNCAMLDSAMQAIPIHELVGLEIVKE